MSRVQELTIGGDMVNTKHPRFVLLKARNHTLESIEDQDLRTVLGTNFKTLQVVFLRQDEGADGHVEKCHVVFLLELENPTGDFRSCRLSQETDSLAEHQVVCRFEARPQDNTGKPSHTVTLCTFPVHTPLPVWDLVSTLFGTNHSRCHGPDRSDLTLFQDRWVEDTGTRETLEGSRDFICQSFIRLHSTDIVGWQGTEELMELTAGDVKGCHFGEIISKSYLLEKPDVETVLSAPIQRGVFLDPTVVRKEKYNGVLLNYAQEQV